MQGSDILVTRLLSYAEVAILSERVGICSQLKLPY